MSGCEGNLVFCGYPRNKVVTTTTTTTVEPVIMTKESVSDSSMSFFNIHPTTFGLTTTGMTCGVFLIAAVCYCIFKHGGLKLIDKIRAPRNPTEQSVRFIPPPAWSAPTFMPQGIHGYNSTPTTSSIPSLASTSQSNPPPMYDELQKVTEKLEKLSVQDVSIKQNQYRIMGILERNGQFEE